MIRRGSGRRGFALLVALVTVMLSGAVLGAVFAWTAAALRTGRALRDRSRAVAEVESAVADGRQDAATLPLPGLRLSDSVWVYLVEGRGTAAIAPLEITVRWVARAGTGDLGTAPAMARWRLVPAY
jgi:type II secretory pathway pseudopilin PulG